MNHYRPSRLCAPFPFGLLSPSSPPVVLQTISLAGVDTTSAPILLSAPQIAAGTIDAGNLYARIEGQPNYDWSLYFPNDLTFFQFIENGRTHTLRYVAASGSVRMYINGVDVGILTSQLGGGYSPRTLPGPRDYCVLEFWIKPTTQKMKWRMWVNGCTHDGFALTSVNGGPGYNRPEYPVWNAGSTYAPGTIVRRIKNVVSDQDPWLFRTAAGGTAGGTEPVWVLTIGALSPVDNTINDWRALQNETNGLSALSNVTNVSIGGDVAGTRCCPWQWTKATFYGLGKSEMIGPTTVVVCGDSIMSVTSSLAWETGHYLRRPQEVSVMADPCNPAIVTLAHPGDGFADQVNVLNASQFVRNSQSVGAFLMQCGFNDLIGGGLAPAIAGNAQALVNIARALGPVILGQTLPSSDFSAPQLAQWMALNLDLAGGGANPVT